MFSSGIFDLALNEDLLSKASIATDSPSRSSLLASSFKKGKKQEVSLSF